MPKIKQKTNSRGDSMFEESGGRGGIGILVQKKREQIAVGSNYTLRMTWVVIKKIYGDRKEISI